MADVLLPAGYHARRAQRSDAALAADLLRICGISEGGRAPMSADDLSNHWGNDFVDVPRDAVVVESVDGVPVAVEMLSQAPPHVTAFSFGGVLPAHCGRGIGTALVEWAIARGLERVPKAPRGTKVELQTFPFADHEPSAELLEGLGFNHTRYFFEMEIEFDGPPDAAPLPAGVTLRQLIPGADDQAASRMMSDVFLDHFGFVEQPDAQVLKRFRQRQEHPEFDPRLWWLAEAGGELVGGIWSSPSVAGNDTLGHVDSLGVVRDWRRRGLGSALLAHAFRQFHDMGKKGVALDVDGLSLTGATALYESAGMSVAARYALYVRELRAGEDLTTTDLDD